MIKLFDMCVFNRSILLVFSLLSVFAFFGQDKSKYGFPKNENALIYTIVYVLSMLVLAFHLWHGFASAFQSVGINHSSYNTTIKYLGKSFAVLIPLGFAIIPLMIFLNKI